MAEPAELDFGLLPTLTGYRLRRAQLRAFGHFEQHLGRFALTPGQVGVLVLVERNAGLSQSALSRALGVERSTLGVTLDRLERRDLLRRDPSPTDRRTNAIHLTDAGARLLVRLLPAMSAQDEALLENLSAAEREQFRAMLARVG